MGRRAGERPGEAALHLSGPKGPVDQGPKKEGGWAHWPSGGFRASYYNGIMRSVRRALAVPCAALFLVGALSFQAAAALRPKDGPAGSGPTGPKPAAEAPL